MSREMLDVQVLRIISHYSSLKVHQFLEMDLTTSWSRALCLNRAQVKMGMSAYPDYYSMQPHSYMLPSIVVDSKYVWDPIVYEVLDGWKLA